MSEASSSKITPFSSIGVPEWDALGPVSQNANFGRPHLPAFDVTMLERQGNHCSTAGLVEQILGFSCFENGGFREAITPVVLPEEGCIVNPLLPTYFSSKNSHDREDIGSKKRKTVDGDKFDSQSSFDRIQNFQTEQHRNMLPETVKGLMEKDERREISGSNTQKSNLRQAKENPQNRNTPKEEYIHIRAKRGQATNSHSLAERVRREKISERMRYLQNLVPGCSKITGKAVMLDEIINYVQSLQRQVEFLSMKLATVNLNLNLDISQILPKDILHVRAVNSTSLMFHSEMSNASSHLQGYIPQPPMQSEMAIHSMSVSQDMLKSNHPNISRMPQVSSTSWDDEFEMGFVPNFHVNNCKEQPGSMNFE